MVKCGPKIEFLNLGESKNPQKVQKGATFPFFKTMNLKVLSKLLLNFLQFIYEIGLSVVLASECIGRTKRASFKLLIMTIQRFVNHWLML